jgi:hypothetical protein
MPALSAATRPNTSGPPLLGDALTVLAPGADGEPAAGSSGHIRTLAPGRALAAGPRAAQAGALAMSSEATSSSVSFSVTAAVSA